jgi:hypothetical protein
MQAYRKFEVENQAYEKIKGVQVSNGNVIREHCIGSRKKLYSFDYLIATTANSSQLELGGITIRQFNAFIGMFNRNVYGNFAKNPDLYYLKIIYKGLSKEKNIELWDSLPEGEVFYNLDLSSAYWQIAHRLGYISDKLFNEYIFQDEFKQVKRYCVSFLARKNYMIYKTVDYEVKIVCDTGVLLQVYSNIRNELYNVIHQVIEKCETWLEYNIDGVLILNDHVQIVKDILTENNLIFKMTRCQKLNEKEYLYGSKPRRFKNK